MHVPKHTLMRLAKVYINTRKFQPVISVQFKARDMDFTTTKQGGRVCFV